MTTPASPIPRPLVLVVDDDPLMRDALQALFRSVGLDSETFASTAALLERLPHEGASCLVLDVRLPGVSGLDFQTQLSRSGRDLPVIFMTGHGDIPMSVRAMKAGALDFLAKPFRDQDMLDAVTAALEKDRAHREDMAEPVRQQGLYRTLSPRERDVMGHVASGLMNKQIAGEIGLSEITVKIHRSNLMRKLGAHTVAELVRIADALQAHPIRESI
jgi:FixJ family two-component response regulator